MKVPELLDAGKKRIRRTVWPAGMYIEIAGVLGNLMDEGHLTAQLEVEELRKNKLEDWEEAPELPKKTKKKKGISDA